MEFALLCSVFDEMEKTRSRLELTKLLAGLFEETSKSEAKKVVYLCQGRISPPHTGIELGIGEKLAEEAIARVAGISAKEVEKSYKQTGDMGNSAEQLLAKKAQKALASEKLTVEKVYENFEKIATAGGQGSQDWKIKLLTELLSNARGTESKTIIRFVTGKQRLGIAEPTILDAFSVMKTGTKELRIKLDRAFNLTSDLGLVAEIFCKEGLKGVEKIKPIPFSPIRPALAERLPDGATIIEKIGKCVVEAKYDGFRIQCHKKGEKVELYSRKQEPMTHMFPDIVRAIREQIKAREIIFEGEAIAFDEATQTYLPFQTTITRKRKHDVEAKAKEIPLHLFVFELLYIDGTDYTNLPYQERRQKLEKIIGEGKIIMPAQIIMAENAKQLEKFFDQCVENGLEGIIGKDLKAPYTAGARKFAWIKLKRSYQGNLADTLDVVIIGFYHGRGKRTQFGFGGLLTAVYAEKEDKFKTIAKVGTGFTEEQMSWFNNELSKIAIRTKPTDVDSVLEPDVWVEPKMVITVNADEITRSPTHTCGKKEKEGEGLALRFPRMEKIREDRNARDATTENEVEKMFKLQGQNRTAVGEA